MAVDAKKPKGYVDNNEIDNETMAEIYRSQIIRGQELELGICDRVAGLINGFKGYSLYWGKKHKNNVKVGYYDKNGKGLPKKAFDQLLINGVFPDVDLVVLSPSNDVVAVISSKGALSDSAVYATVWHGENWPFPLYVVTKDEKGIFVSGNSKYIPLLLNAGVKVIISNHLDYDKPTESGKWDSYEWSETVNPDHVLYSDLHKLIIDNRDNNEFFNWRNSK